MVACDPDVMTIEQFKKSLQFFGLIETTTNSVAQSTNQSQAITDSRLFATISPLVSIVDRQGLSYQGFY